MLKKKSNDPWIKFQLIIINKSCNMYVPKSVLDKDDPIISFPTRRLADLFIIEDTIILS